MIAGAVIFLVGAILIGVCSVYRPYDHSDPIPVTVMGMWLGALLLIIGTVILAIAVLK